MIHTGKKILSMLLCVALLLSAAACGSGKASADLDGDQVEADVQEYITSFVDPSATVTSLYQSQNSISETQTEVSCQVSYTSDSGDGSGVVTLLYDFTGSEWALTNCTADLGAASGAAPEAEPEPEMESETAPDAAPEAAPETESEAAPAEQSTAPAAAPAPATGSDTARGGNHGTLAGVTLTEIGTFDNPSAGSLSTAGYAIALKGNESVTMYGPNGAAGEYANCQALSGDTFGYTIVDALNASDENCRGLVNATGELVLPCEAVWIDTIYGSNRFVEVYYSTGECSASDDYLLKLSSWFSDEEHYYTGYRKIFDLQTYSFVGNIQVTSTDSSAIRANETMVYVDENDTSTLYGASGNVITETTSNIFLSTTLAEFNMDGCTYVFDENGERFTTAGSLSPISGNGDYFTIYKDGSETIIDGNGNEVLPGTTFSSVTSCYNDVFEGKNADESAYQLIDIKGNTLYEGTEMPSYVDKFVDGWWYISPSVGNDTLISAYTTVECSTNGAYCLTPNDASGNYIVLNTGETLALGSGSNRQGYGMVSSRGSSGKYAIYEMFNGTTLTDAVYTNVLYSYGYVYALDGSTWHVFQVENIYK